MTKETNIPLSGPMVCFRCSSTCSSFLAAAGSESRHPFAPRHHAHFLVHRPDHSSSAATTRFVLKCAVDSACRVGRPAEPVSFSAAAAAPDEKPASHKARAD
jgi:hypothetical protein